MKIGLPVSHYIIKRFILNASLLPLLFIILGIFVLLQAKFNSLILDINKSFVVKAVLLDQLKDDEIAALKTAIEKTPNAINVRLVKKEDALKELSKDEYWLEEFKDISFNPLPNSIDFNIEDALTNRLNFLSATDKIKKLNGVDHLIFDKNGYEQNSAFLKNYLHLFKSVSIVISILAFFVLLVFEILLLIFIREVHSAKTPANTDGKTKKLILKEEIILNILESLIGSIAGLIVLFIITKIYISNSSFIIPILTIDFINLITLIVVLRLGVYFLVKHIVSKKQKKGEEYEKI